MRFTISSPVMPDTVVDYDLSNGKWNIVQQQNLLHEKTRVLYGSPSSGSRGENLPFSRVHEVIAGDDQLLNDLAESYGCEYYDVPSDDGVVVPLTVVYSHHRRKEGQSPGLLHGHGAYGDILDQRWRTELKSLLDRGWDIAYVNVPFLDPTNILLYPIFPLTPVDYEEFGYPGDVEDFQAIRKYSPCDNIRKGVLYPSVLVTSSFNIRCIEGSTEEFLRCSARKSRVT